MAANDRSFSYTKFFRSGKIRSEGAIREGRHHGKIRKNFESGELAAEAVFENGELKDIHGSTSQSKTTLLQFLQEPNCDIQLGRKSYYPSGAVQCEIVLDDNQQTVLREYMEYGPILKETVYKDNIAVSGYYYDDYEKRFLTEKALRQLNDECEYQRW